MSMNGRSQDDDPSLHRRVQRRPNSYNENGYWGTKRQNNELTTPSSLHFHRSIPAAGRNQNTCSGVPGSDTRPNKHVLMQG
jgi:hypothetical protein